VTFTPHTDDEIRQMLATVGPGSVEKKKEQKGKKTRKIRNSRRKRRKVKKKNE